jgi:predicted CXXCH cytochrome family protein
MKMPCLPIHFKRVLLGSILVLLLPQSVQALNPNHQCSYCHLVHAAPGPSLNVGADVDVLCLSCHGPLGIATVKVALHSNRIPSDYAAFSISCRSCHDPHDSQPNWLGGTNLLMVGSRVDSTGYARITTPAGDIRDVVFESRGSDAGEPTLHSFADHDEDANGILDGACELCHTQTYYHRNDPNGDHGHFTGETCIGCHPHEKGFVGSGGCTRCHNAPQDNGDGVPAGGRRAVDAEFTYASHHAGYADADCAVCHETTLHHRGNLRFLHADTQAVIALAGDPFTTSAEALKLVGFCLSCHDSNGANGSAPFADGRTPREIKSGIWDASIHKTTNYSCYGNGQTTGCHSSGHGSMKSWLLPVYGTPPVSGDEEEGFCYRCHGTGSTATDIQSQIAKAYSHSVQSYSGLHDSQEAIPIPSTSRHVECADCHNPHYASAANPLKEVAGIDLAGTPVGPGRLIYRDIAEYEACLKCHGDTYNSARPRTTNKRIDFNPGNSSFHPVAGAGRNTSAAMAAQLLGGLTVNSTILCSDCHNNEATADVTGPARNSPAVPKGPHGSANDFATRAFYWTSSTGPSSYDRNNYALCYLCHNTEAFETTDVAQTTFAGSSENLHYIHVTGSASTGVQCANCHYNSHSNQNETTTFWRINGVNYSTPPAGFKTRGVSFSPDVTGTAYARPAWALTTSTRRRSCMLNCHGKMHGFGMDYLPSATYDTDMSGSLTSSRAAGRGR